MMSDIILDTYKLNQYAQRISAVNSRIGSLDSRLNSLYLKVGLKGIFDLIQADVLTCYSWRLVRCQSYLQQTALDFEKVEKELQKEDPLSFEYPQFWIPSLSNAPFLFGSNVLGTPAPSSIEFHKSVWDVIKKELSDIPEDAESVGEALAWIEKEWGKLPNCITLGIDILFSSTLKNAYNLTSGFLQDNLTLQDGWGAAKSILSKDSKLAVICDTLDYTLETGIERSEEGQRQVIEQLREGDVLGAVFDGAETFVDTIVGGSIEVLGDLGGTAVDTAINKTVIGKSINTLTEYGTGLLGFNGGEGYSVGGLISATTEIISDGIDAATDAITDATNSITDAVTDGFKTSINWVKSWFD